MGNEIPLSPTSTLTFPAPLPAFQMIPVPPTTCPTDSRTVILKVSCIISQKSTLA